MTTWYIKNGSDMELVERAITMARVTGSREVTETVDSPEGETLRSAAVSNTPKEGFDLFLKR